MKSTWSMVFSLFPSNAPHFFKLFFKRKRRRRIRRIRRRRRRRSSSSSSSSSGSSSGRRRKELGIGGESVHLKTQKGRRHVAPPPILLSLLSKFWNLFLWCEGARGVRLGKEDSPESGGKRVERKESE